jgi:hypothetical protein
MPTVQDKELAYTKYQSFFASKIEQGKTYQKKGGEGVAPPETAPPNPVPPPVASGTNNQCKLLLQAKQDAKLVGHSNHHTNDLPFPS